MSQEVTLDQAMQIALRHHRAGQLAEAEAIYRQVLGANPNHVDALHLLGKLAGQLGRGEAIELLRRATIAEPLVPAYRISLSSQLARAGRHDEALAEAKRAVELNADLPEAHKAVGAVLLAMRDPAEAEAAFGRAIALSPNDAEALSNLGLSLRELGKAEQSIGYLRRAIEADPKMPEGRNNLGLAFQDLRQYEKAAEAFRAAVSLRPHYVNALANLGRTLRNLKRYDEAIEVLRKALALDPRCTGAHFNLGLALGDRFGTDAALAAQRKAVRALPDEPTLHNNLANTLKDMGRLDEALAEYRRAVEIRPEYDSAYSNYLYSLYFHPEYDARRILEEHRQWARQYVDGLPAPRPFDSIDRAPDRPLKIGFVSPDLRRHVVGRFLLPLLKFHDGGRFQFHCYSDVRAEDDVTQLLRQHSQGWHETRKLSDAELAGKIRDDGIDILIDLTLHMAGSRLLCFARKPAPVQATWLGYAGTTGLDTIDWRISDPCLDPPGAGDECYAERTWRIPSYWCYESAAESPEIAPSPAGKEGYITFGCLNNFCKISGETIQLWAETMRAVVESRLIVHSRPGSHRDAMLASLESLGIKRSRVSFVAHVPSPEYFQLYNQIDIALDTTPYGGGTTSCDALWMGVPLVTLAGKTAVGRGGVSLLNQIGLPELVANSGDEYVRIAIALADNYNRLAELRRTMRERMLGSRLMDGPAFARDFEAALGGMWDISRGESI